MSDNKNLKRAKEIKDDEFYTRLSDVEKECAKVRGSFKGKHVLCCCDDPTSAFRTYFDANYDVLGLASLTCTSYSPSSRATAYIRTPDGARDVPLDGDGDFRSPECRAFMEACDVVVTNPPFSLFGEFMSQITECGCNRLVLGPANATTYTDVFPSIIAGTLWLGDGRPRRYGRPDGGERTLNNVVWFTDLDRPSRHEPLRLARRLGDAGKVALAEGRAVPVPGTRRVWSMFDALPDALDVDYVADIPLDWDGVMGVPVTYLNTHCPEQFEIVGTLGAGGETNLGPATVRVDGATEERYKRILIRRRAPAETSYETSYAQE